MACNSCSKSFTLFRKEKGCPGCGFSYCSKCLNNKLFLKKINSVALVCTKCKNTSGMDNKNKIETPEAYFKRIGVDNSSQSTSSQTTEQSNNVEWEIQQRLKKLKEDRNKDAIQTTDEEILKRLQKIKGEQPTTSDAELQARLANLRGVPIIEGQKKTVLYTPDLRTEQEQADDLMKQYLEHTTIDKQYQEGFKRQLDDIEARIQKLKGGEGVNTKTKDDASSSEDEETVIKKIIEKAKVESSQDDELPAATNDELPFCEICNEDARMRCLGCRYLFCKQCFVEHKDDDDGCNRYELYEAPKNIN
ncbi:abscission/NoCut checkpoint regulator isoform X1 [Ostrinia nubilalis]|uniref:abscission/NoCut checkpoint regulator isoform X1 n=2 Tax=Ostrinia nubilalis TaxID=29057 RepID=UPI0030823038